MKPCQALPVGASIVEGVWEQIIHYPQDATPRPALFLDRDGVVLVDTNYLHEAAKVSLIAGAAGVIKRAGERGIAAVLITNQAGIGLGYFGWDDFINVQECLLDQLAAAGAALDGVFACPFHAESEPPYRHPDHPARKPNPGMLLRAAEQLNIDLAASWIIGDRMSDLAAGRNAGIEGGQHVLTGHGGDEGERAAAMALDDGGGFRAVPADSIADALDLIPMLKG